MEYLRVYKSTVLESQNSYQHSMHLMISVQAQILDIPLIEELKEIYLKAYYGSNVELNF